MISGDTTNETISPVAAKGGNIISINGLGDAATLNANGIVPGITYASDTKTFTVSAKLLNEESVTLTADVDPEVGGSADSYALAMGSDVAEPTERSKYWTATDVETLRTAKYYEGTGTTAGYSVDSSAPTIIAYVEEKHPDLTIEVDGLKTKTATSKNNSINGLILTDDTLKIASNVIDTDGVTVSGTGYNYIVFHKITSGRN